MLSSFRPLTAVAFGAAVLMAAAPEARADEVSPTGKGIVGGALLGGEVVMITESLFRIESGWAYAIGGGLGAIGGGIGGYFIEQGSTNGRVPVYMLAGGLALIIPTLVLTLNATRYHPTEGASEDRAPTNGPAADPGKAGGSVIVGPGGATNGGATTAPGQGGTTTAPSPAPAAPVPPGAPQSLLDVWAPGGLGGAGVGDTAVRVSVPVPEVRPMYTVAEQKAYGVPAQTELRMPIFRVTF